MKNAMKIAMIAAVMLWSAALLSPKQAMAGQCTCNGSADVTAADTQAGCEAYCGSNGGVKTFIPSSSSAGQGISPTGATPLENPLAGVCSGKQGTECVQVVIGNVIKWAFGIVGSIALLVMMWGGFQWLIARGNSDKVEKGKDTLIWATIGLVVIFGAYTIASFVINAIASKPAATSSGPSAGTSASGLKSSGTVCESDSECESGTCLPANGPVPPTCK